MLFASVANGCGFQVSIDVDFPRVSVVPQLPAISLFLATGLGPILAIVRYSQLVTKRLAFGSNVSRVSKYHGSLGRRHHDSESQSRSERLVHSVRNAALQRFSKLRSPDPVVCMQQLTSESAPLFGRNRPCSGEVVPQLFPKQF